MGNSKEELIEKLISEILRVIKEGIFNENIIRYRELLYILGHLLHEKGFLKRNTEEERSILEEAINQLAQKYGDTSEKFLDNIYDKVLDELKEVRRTEPEFQSFFVLFTYNLSEEDMQLLSGVKFMQIPIEIVKFDDYRFILNHCQSFVKYSGRYYNDFWVKIKVKAHSINEALKCGWRYAENLRSLANFFLTKNTYALYQFPPQPLSVILPSKFYFVLDDNEKYCTHGLNSGEYEFRTTYLNVDKMREVIDFVNKFDDFQEEKIKEILLECIWLYCIALDLTGVDYPYSYGLLWSVIEKIVKKIFGENKKFISFLKSLYHNDNILSELINALWKKRNLFAHEGTILDVELEDMNWVRLIVCDLINKAISKYF
ncbi:hypothetical protein [Dictyoglomus thermophilum]|uniref:Apea-like HEPN domain-containing protein n=1 Tax=Dictyoglomus thermophilum (strain ATCC 35947 / DSM 3960 / H-6-12) TaxID=309799 RepID=B5YC35_DICT6|nr:hypothetical protein [Dictyoglomus thermophilum]ACI18885.1 hypothetical protein DICTH_0260 [Dictyoglomus thermophilum H-6-12]